MCLAIPGKIVEVYEEHDMPMGKVDFGGVFKRVCLVNTPQAQPGQYVIVHVGFALQIVDEDEARQVFAFLESMNELGDLHIAEAFDQRSPLPRASASSQIRGQP